jgi:hypothetical protein
MKPHVVRLSLVAGLIALAATFVSEIQAQEPAEAPPKPGEAQKVRGDQSTDSRRQALQLLAEAEIALEEGHTARASALAREAQRLYPESKAIAGFLASFQAEQPAAKAMVTTHNRAKAHLAAALTRAQVLMQQRRYTESLDLLNGIVEAAEKFPSGTDVSLYRDLAQKELIEYRVGVQVGRIRPNLETPAPRVPDSTSETAVGPTSAEFTAAPSNAYRLARVSKEQTPAWYSRTKSALRRNMSVDYRSMPLGLVLDDVQQASGVTVIVDTPIQAAKTTLTSLVDLRVNTVPAETVLYLATQVAGCEYVLLEKGIIITTADKAGDYIRNLPDSVSHNWSRARFLFPDLYLDAMSTRPLPEAKPSPTAAAEEKPDAVPSYLRSGRDLVAHIEQLIR